MLKLATIITFSFLCSVPALQGSELLPPSSSELSVVDPELAKTEKFKESFLKSLQNEIYNFNGFSEDRKAELERKFGLSEGGYTQQDIQKASMEWSRNNLTQYDSINEVTRVNPPLSAHGKQTILSIQNSLDALDLEVIRFFEELAKDLRKPLRINEDTKKIGQSDRKLLKTSERRTLVESSAISERNSGFKQVLIDFIQSGIPSLQIDFFKSEKAKMIKLVNQQAQVSEESFRFFKSMVKLLARNEGITEYEHMDLLKKSLMISDLRSMDAAILNLKRIYVISSRYSYLKGFNSLYRMQTHPSNSFVSYASAHFQGNYFNLSLIAGWFASSQGKYSEALDSTMRSYFDFINKTLNAEANIEVDNLKNDIKEKRYANALKDILDMSEASRRANVLTDIKFLMDSMFRAETLGRDIEFKLASLMLKDREFMTKFGSVFIENILVRPHYHSGVIHKISNHANPEEVLNVIKKKIKTEYKWIEWGGPWSITDVESKLRRFYTLHPVGLVKALGHNLSPARISGATTKLLQKLSGKEPTKATKCKLAFKDKSKD